MRSAPMGSLAIDIDVKGISADCGSQLVVGGASSSRSGGICRGTGFWTTRTHGLTVVEGEKSYMVL